MFNLRFVARKSQFIIICRTSILTSLFDFTPFHVQWEDIQFLQYWNVLGVAGTLSLDRGVSNSLTTIVQWYMVRILVSYTISTVSTLSTNFRRNREIQEYISAHCLLWSDQLFDFLFTSFRQIVEHGE
jgi:hypothetical protein